MRTLFLTFLGCAGLLLLCVFLDALFVAIRCWYRVYRYEFLIRAQRTELGFEDWYEKNYE